MAGVLYVLRHGIFCEQDGVLRISSRGRFQMREAVSSLLADYEQFSSPYNLTILHSSEPHVVDSANIFPGFSFRFKKNLRQDTRLDTAVACKRPECIDELLEEMQSTNVVVLAGSFSLRLVSTYFAADKGCNPGQWHRFRPQ